MVISEESLLYGGLIRLHILHHARAEDVYGQALSRELSRHGYRIGCGTLYPMLSGLRRRGYLRAVAARRGARRHYRITAAGRAALARSRRKVRELYGELLEGK